MTDLSPLVALLFSLFTQYVSSPAPEKLNESTLASIKPVAEDTFAKVSEAVSENENFWSAPYVLADIENGEVWVWGQHTGMGRSEPLEFFVISEMSGHDYESLMVSFAIPSNIHQALLRIGAKPGGSVSAKSHRFWPRGSRIVAEVMWIPEGQTEAIRMPVEKTARTQGADMPLTPWVFTGAPMLPSFEQENELVYGPDLFTPNSIASTFNLENTVFDLPFQGGKTQTYGNFIRNPAVSAPEGQPMLLHLRLARADEVPTELDVHLSFSGADGKLSVAGIDELTALDLAELGSFLNSRKHEVHYLHSDFGPDLSLARVTTLARELQLLEQHVSSVRIQPPQEGQLFYKAFVPDPRYKSRENRPSQPIEIHLSSSGGKEVTATLMELEEIWGDSRKPTVVETPVPLDTPGALVRYLEDPEKQKPVLFIYADPALTHKDLQAWTSTVLDQFPVVFVYLNGH